MNITALGSVSSYTSLFSSLSASSRSSQTGSSSTSTDSASISASAFAAFLQEQGGGGPPQISDEQAAKIGTSLQGKNATLFKALDANQDGTLSADELKTGLEALRPQGGAQSGNASGPGELSDSDAASFGASLQKSNSSLFSALDSNQDGTLSADELKSGMDSLRSAMDANGMAPPPPPQGGQDGSNQGDLLAQLLSGLSSADGNSGSTSTSDYQANLLNELLKSLDSGTAA